MSRSLKFLDGCEDCERERKKIKHLWVLVWPSGKLLSRNPGIPAAFYTKKEGLRFKFNSTYETPKLVKFSVAGDASR